MRKLSVRRRWSARLSSILVLVISTHASVAQTTDPVAPFLAEFQSADLISRENAFYALLNLGATTGVGTGSMLESEVSGLLSSYPSDRSKIVSALTTLLTIENTDASLGASTADPQNEDDSDFYLDLLEAVADLNDPSTINSLVGGIGSGAVVTSRLASFGPIALDAVVAQTYSPYIHDRNGAAFTLTTMLSKPYVGLVSDETSQSKIRAGLTRAVASFAPPSPYSYVQTTYQSVLNRMGAAVRGDVNGDGVVNCADLIVIKSSFGKSYMQPGFDIRADVNGDGVVNIVDLSIESRLMPAGTVCQ